MRKVLVISEEVFLNLYKAGLQDYSNSHDDVQIDLYCLDVAKKNLQSLNRLKYKLDINDFRRKYYDKQRMELIELVKEYDTILFFNLFFDKEFFIKDKFRDVLKEKDARVYFLDSVKTFNIPKELLSIFKHVYVFERNDVQYIEETYSLNVTWVSCGTSYFLFDDTIAKHSVKTYDVCFVGIATPKRLEYLDAVAKWCKANNKSFFCSGHFWHTNNALNFWVGKQKFKWKYPVLAEYVKNQFIQPCELAGVYAQSKIVLNINVSYHKGFNQRAFDVMYSKSLLLCDDQDASGLDIKENVHYIMGKDVNGIIAKLAKYLDESAQEDVDAIIKNGRDITEQSYLYKNTLDCLLTAN